MVSNVCSRSHGQPPGARSRAMIATDCSKRRAASRRIGSQKCRGMLYSWTFRRLIHLVSFYLDRKREPSGRSLTGSSLRSRSSQNETCFPVVLHSAPRLEGVLIPKEVTHGSQAAGDSLCLCVRRNGIGRRRDSRHARRAMLFPRGSKPSTAATAPGSTPFSSPTHPALADAAFASAQFRGQSGGLNLLAVTSSGPSNIAFRVQEKSQPTVLIGKFELTAAKPQTISNFVLRAGSAGRGARRHQARCGAPQGGHRGGDRQTE